MTVAVAPAWHSKVGRCYGAYPERRSGSTSHRDRRSINPIAYLPRSLRLIALRQRELQVAVQTAAAQFAGRDVQCLTDQVPRLRRRLRHEGITLAGAAQAFALTGEIASQTLGRRPFETQIAAAWVMLNDMVAEMATGEGKTLAVGLAAATAALTGLPVHVITANDYLARRDRDALQPLYRALGLSVGLVTSTSPPQERRAAYARDLTYCTARELAFDYLRDRGVFGAASGEVARRVDRVRGQASRTAQLLLRGLHFAIVDECDQTLIDEARVPLILSGGCAPAADAARYQEALQLARTLREGRDYRCRNASLDIALTRDGRQRVLNDATVGDLSGIGEWEREALVGTALQAMHQLQRGRHYLVRDGCIQLIDDHTGRVRQGHAWQRGLQQMVEIKEGLSVTTGHAVTARITYQRLFRRYLHLSGTTGTATEVSGELRSVYALGAVRISTRLPVQRRRYPAQWWRTTDQKWAAVVARLCNLQAAGRPVLVGTRTVAASEELSARLTAAGLPHRVLSALQDRHEAEVVSGAGEAGQITVATNMAGRGTDIELGTDVASLGGLHVLATECHEAHRIDRQLQGRCARQGDPGSHELIASLDDALLREYCPRWLLAIATRLWGKAYWCQGLSAFSGWLAQTRAERHHASSRRALLSSQDRLDSAMGFTGGAE